MPNVREIVREYLVANGFGGLCGEYCGCPKEDLMPCDSYCGDCFPGHKLVNPPCGDCADYDCDGHEWEDAKSIISAMKDWSCFKPKEEKINEI